jgi:hypothetical protein
MKITLPTSAVGFLVTSFNVSLPGQVVQQYHFLVAGETTEEDVIINDTLLQITEGHNTDVCHGKVLMADIPMEKNNAWEMMKQVWIQLKQVDAQPNTNHFIGINPDYNITWVGSQDDRHHTKVYAWKEPGKSVVRRFEWYFAPRRNQTWYQIWDFEAPYEAAPTAPNKTNVYINSYMSYKTFNGYVDMDACIPYHEEHKYLRRLSAYKSRIDGIEYDLSSLPHPSHFWYNEPNVLTGKAFWAPQIIRGMQDAFLDSYSNVQHLADNNLTNTAEILKMIAQIVDQGWIKVPETIADLWLWWRYCYNTTRSDLRQGVNYCSRKLGGILKPRKFHGAAKISGSSQGTSDIDVRVGYDAVLDVSNMPQMISYRLHQAGVEVTPYTLWDFIPFSFVVDWFVPVGDRLKMKDDIRHLTQDYVITNCVFSLKYTKELIGSKCQYYTRFYSAPPSMDDYTYYDTGGTGLFTSLKRAVDIPALVCGRM